MTKPLYGYGDSWGDWEMLELADHAWLRELGATPPIEGWQRKVTAS